MDKNSLLSLSGKTVYSSNKKIDTDYGLCEACGATSVYRFEPIIPKKLAKQWSLTERQQHEFSARESMFCLFCTCSYRLRKLAKSLVYEVGTSQSDSLQEIIERGAFDNLTVAEINSCGVLHGILAGIKNLKYSEYSSSDSRVPHQDIMELTYVSESMDIVLTSDTLEHVPDYRKALSEIYRILKPGGVHIFTIPILLDRKTVQRAQVSGDIVDYKAEASYHGAGQPDYLVINEFGYDFLDELKAVGFSVTLDHINLNNIFEPGIVIVARKLMSKNRSAQPIIYADTDETQKAMQTVEYLGLGENFSIAKSEPAENFSELQIEKLRWLANKIQLTNTHVRNLESINGEYLKEIGKLRKHIEMIEERLLKNRLNRVMRSFKR